MDKIFIYHSKDPDGLTCYTLGTLIENFNSKCEFIGWDREPNPGWEQFINDGINPRLFIFCDIAPTREQAVSLLQHGNYIHVFDHHPTSSKELTGIMIDACNGEPRVFYPGYGLDETVSGCMVYFKHRFEILVKQVNILGDLHVDLIDLQRKVEIVSSYDTWQFVNDKPGSVEFINNVHNYLNTLVMNRDEYASNFIESDIRNMNSKGSIVSRNNIMLAKKALDRSVQLGPTTVLLPSVDVTLEVNSMTWEKYPGAQRFVTFKVEFNTRFEAIMKASIRSKDGSARVIAEKFGGGGHDDAGGFSIKPNDVSKLHRFILDNYF
jgi:hypothetical protein